MKLKNYTKEGQKLPLFGIGPYLIYGIGLFTAICIVLFEYVFKIVQMGKHDELLKQEGIYKNFITGRKQAVSWKLA